MNHLEFWASNDFSHSTGSLEWNYKWQQNLQDDPAVALSKAWSSPQISSPQDSKNENIFDLASLTKVLCAGALIVKWAELEGVSLSQLGLQKISKFLPDLSHSSVKNLSLEELWEHRSALIANYSLADSRNQFFHVSQRELLHKRLYEMLNDTTIITNSKQTVYSDVGFMALALILEKVFSQTMDQQWNQLKTFLKINETLDFAVNNIAFSKALPTETRHPSGIVNDDKAFVMGGVAAHAGLFGNIGAIKEWLSGVFEWADHSSQAREWLYDDRSKVSSRFSWGWDTASGAKDSHAGMSAPMGTRGHLGYTGTAFWLHPSSRKCSILLSNRVYPQHSPQSQKSIQVLRTGFFEAFWQGKLEDRWKT